MLDAFIAAREGRLALPDADLEAALEYEEQRARAAAKGFATLAAEAPAGADTWAWLQDRQSQYADFHAARLRVVTSGSADPSADFLAVRRPPLPDRNIDDLGLSVTQCRKIAL
ncbi:hypothetical protein [Gemmobacter sp. 24YEA27]|uniref:hypothetical protein n=1 Tax=Gemmobacter sp. 24YEA27 TaxID=3040672 RepID=UPI0024B320EC|nr:hypothetical protein [Gemmobacter sp. 24YEA27]